MSLVSRCCKSAVIALTYAAFLPYSFYCVVLTRVRLFFFIVIFSVFFSPFQSCFCLVKTFWMELYFYFGLFFFFLFFSGLSSFLYCFSIALTFGKALSIPCYLLLCKTILVYNLSCFFFFLFLFFCFLFLILFYFSIFFSLHILALCHYYGTLKGLKPNWVIMP